MPEERDLSPILFEDSPSSSPSLSGPEGAGAAAGGAFEVFGTSIEEAVREMRFRIEQKTMLTASAGEQKTTLTCTVCTDTGNPEKLLHFNVVFSRFEKCFDFE